MYEEKKHLEIKKNKNRQFIILSSIIMYKIELELFHVSDEYWYTSNQASQDVPDQYKPKKNMNT